MFSVFNEKISEALNKIPFDKLQEIRVRNGRPIIVMYAGKNLYLSKDGATSDVEKSIRANFNEAEQIILKATDYSVYTVADMLKRGFLPLRQGARLGICGEWVKNGDQIKTVKNFTSVTFRVPHQVFGCAQKLISLINRGGSMQGVLVLSVPGRGKTTLVRDMARILSHKHNVLIIDERYEIAASGAGGFGFDVGFCDVICGAGRTEGVLCGIRACSPQIIVTDEITAADFDAIYSAKTCGVSVIASVHAKSVEQLLQKDGFDIFIKNKIFSHYVLLSEFDIGKISCVYNENLEEIC